MAVATEKTSLEGFSRGISHESVESAEQRLPTYLSSIAVTRSPSSRKEGRSSSKMAYLLLDKKDQDCASSRV